MRQKVSKPFCVVVVTVLGSQSHTQTLPTEGLVTLARILGPTSEIESDQ